jgi:hypothetical protein
MREVTLRYVDCRGRAEPLRHLLRARAVSFTDHREPITDIRRTILEYRQDATRGGPFGLLPVLEWDGACIAQTLPIATFLSRELGLYAGMGTLAMAREEALASAAYLELTSAFPNLVWAPLWFAEVPFERHLKMQSRVACSHPARFQPLLAAGAPFFGGEEPHAPDFFLFEGLTAWIRLLGEPFAEGIRTKPSLSAWWERMNDRLAGTPGLDRPITASPYEAEVCERARGVVASQGLPWVV